MKDNILIKGILPALITPFDDGQMIRKASVKPLLDYGYSAGVDGFYVCGGTGEGPVLRPSARMDMLEAVMDANGGRGKIVVHVGAPNPLDTIDLARHAEKCGADAVSCLAPLYQYKYTADELISYYRRLAGSVSTPLIVYAAGSLPASASLAVMKELLTVDNVIGIKYSLDDYAAMMELKRLNGGNINVLNGPDDTLLCGLSMGADGGIGATYNIMPDRYVGIYRAFIRGDIAEARRIQGTCNDVLRSLLKYSKNSSIKSVKAVLSMMGFDVGHAAYPAEHYSDETMAALKKEMTELDILR